MVLAGTARHLFFMLVGAFILSAESPAGHFTPETASSLKEISGHIYNDRFERASELIDSLEASGTPSILRLFSRAAWYQSKMMADESDSLAGFYFAVLDSLENAAEAVIEAGGDSVLAYCYLGHAHAFRSLYYGRTGGLWKAFRSGMAARKAYSKGYEMDSTFYDLGLGLGSYRYWKSVKTKAINWTPLFKNERVDGINLIRLAADSSEVSRDAAVISLIWIYINEELYDDAIRLASEMRLKYPHGHLFLWAIAEAYYKKKDYLSAAEKYRIILTRQKRNPGNYYNLVEAAYYLGRCYRELSDNYPEAEKLLNVIREEIRQSPIPEKTRHRQKDKIKKILKED